MGMFFKAKCPQCWEPGDDCVCGTFKAQREAELTMLERHNAARPPVVLSEAVDEREHWHTIDCAFCARVKP